ncbi:hypothetical protein CLV43_103374 [Umezawaea tangerina]|uniref:Uncharacterized protein n=1 Tax=Umezawaea tangerina TaxID=84725 RepID=A0A2T0TD85_9PSEU|nr:hypothetical protein CLV43_103374 [Umezawaea tangerina]
MDDLVELGLADDDNDTEVEGAEVEQAPSTPLNSRAGFAGSVVALVLASVAGVALFAWIILFWLAPPFLAWLDSLGF